MPWSLIKKVHNLVLPTRKRDHPLLLTERGNHNIVKTYDTRILEKAQCIRVGLIRCLYWYPILHRHFLGTGLAYPIYQVHYFIYFF